MNGSRLLGAEWPPWPSPTADLTLSAVSWMVEATVMVEGRGVGVEDCRSVEMCLLVVLLLLAEVIEGA